jgi:hypothetical protein
MKIIITALVAGLLMVVPGVGMAAEKPLTCAEARAKLQISIVVSLVSHSTLGSIGRTFSDKQLLDQTEKMLVQSDLVGKVCNPHKGEPPWPAYSSDFNFQKEKP